MQRFLVGGGSGSHGGRGVVPGEPLLWAEYPYACVPTVTNAQQPCKVDAGNPTLQRRKLTLGKHRSKCLA